MFVGMSNWIHVWNCQNKEIYGPKYKEKQLTGNNFVSYFFSILAEILMFSKVKSVSLESLPIGGFRIENLWTESRASLDSRNLWDNRKNFITPRALDNSASLPEQSRALLLSFAIPWPAPRLSALTHCEETRQAETVACWDIDSLRSQS